MYIHCEMITTVELINTSITPCTLFIPFFKALSKGIFVSVTQ